MGTIAYVTAVECAGLYRWLRHSLTGRAVSGAFFLVLEETLESGLLVYIFVQGPADPSKLSAPGASEHLQKAQGSAALAINLEIMIWLVWLSMRNRFPRWLAGLWLLVTMHLKHALEAATVRDTPYLEECRSARVSIGSLSETIGATYALRLMRARRYRAGGLALTTGIGFEHVLFINEVQAEMQRRDISLPRPASSSAAP